MTRLHVVTSRAPEDRRWYAALMDGGDEVVGVGWYDTEIAARIALSSRVVRSLGKKRARKFFDHLARVSRSP